MVTLTLICFCYITGMSFRYVPPFPLLSKTNQPTNFQQLPDIGGGSVSNKTRNSLARITLRWMVRECFKAATGIMFNSSALQEDLGMDPSSLYPYVTPRPPLLLLSPGIDRIRNPPAKEIPIRAHNYFWKKAPSANHDAEPEPDMHTLIEGAVPFYCSFQRPIIILGITTLFIYLSIPFIIIKYLRVEFYSYYIFARRICLRMWSNAFI
jgi:hypothetical protein